jgi:hypothetical protein
MRYSRLCYSSKLWGGRFTGKRHQKESPKKKVNKKKKSFFLALGKTDPIMEQFNNSLNVDKRLWKVDLFASKEYAIALSECGILKKEEAAKIGEGKRSLSESDISKLQ